MIFTEKYNVRWHDTDAGREVHPTGVLALMQETGNRQFEKAGRPLDAIRDEMGVGFILSRISVDMLSPIHAYEDIEVETFTCEGRGIIFPRGFVMKRAGEVVARGTSQWALVRISDRTLLKVGEFPMSFGDEPEVVTDTPLRFRVPRDAAWEQVGERRVLYSDIDYNMHMNNTKYPNMVCDFLPSPEKTRVLGISLYYCREAAYGDTLSIERAVGEERGTYLFRARKGDAVCMEAFVRTEEVPERG